MNNEERKIIAFPISQEETPAPDAIVGEVEEFNEEIEDAEVNLKSKYTLTEDRIKELGEELAEKKQAHLDYLYELRTKAVTLRKEREERMAKATPKERYEILKQESKEATERVAQAKAAATAQKVRDEKDLAMLIARDLFGEHLPSELVAAIQKDKPNRKERRSRRGKK